jgi:hypothetical protein
MKNLLATALPPSECEAKQLQSHPMNVINKLIISSLYIKGIVVPYWGHGGLSRRRRRRIL